MVRQVGVEKPPLLGPLREADGSAADVALALFHRANIVAERAADIRVDIWTKYIAAIATTGVQSVTGCGIEPTRADPDTREMYIDVMREVEALARKSGVAPPEGIPERMMGIIGTYPADGKASMLQDLERGKPLELEAMHGTAVRLGEKLGVPTPVNHFIYTALKLRAGGTGVRSL